MSLASTEIIEIPRCQEWQTKEHDGTDRMGMNVDRLIVNAEGTFKRFRRGIPGSSVACKDVFVVLLPLWQLIPLEQLSARSCGLDLHLAIALGFRRWQASFLSHLFLAAADEYVGNPRVSKVRNHSR